MIPKPMGFFKANVNKGESSQGVIEMGSAITRPTAGPWRLGGDGYSQPMGIRQVEEQHKMTPLALT